MAKEVTEYRYIGNHPQDIIVGDRSVQAEPGDFVKLTSDDLENYLNADLNAQGLLLKVGEDK